MKRKMLQENHDMMHNVWFYIFFPLSGSGPSGPSSGISSPAHMPLPSHSVPDFSYSSSEDEFYDADEFYQSTTSPKHCIEWVQYDHASPQPSLHTVNLLLYSLKVTV